MTNQTPVVTVAENAPTTLPTFTPTHTPTPTSGTEVVDTIDIGFGALIKKTESDYWIEADGKRLEGNGWSHVRVTNVGYDENNKAILLILPLLSNDYTGEYYITEAEKEAGYEELLICNLDREFLVEGLGTSGVNEYTVGYNVIYAADKKMFIVDDKEFSVENGWKCRKILDHLFVIPGYELIYVEVLYNANTGEKYIPEYAKEYEDRIMELFDRMR